MGKYILAVIQDNYIIHTCMYVCMYVGTYAATVSA